MNHESLISLMDGVSDDLIVEAAAPQRKTLTLRRGIAFAAAVAAVLALVLGIPFLNRDNEIVTLPGVITVNAITDPSKSEGVPLEEADSEFFIEPFSVHTFANWTRGAPIYYTVPDSFDNIKIQLSVSNGFLQPLYMYCPEGHPIQKNLTIEYDPRIVQRVDWVPDQREIDEFIPDGFDFTQHKARLWDHIQIILWEDNHIIGYAVVRVSSSNGFSSWELTLLDSVYYPKVDNKYQKISEKYVRQQIQKQINSTKGGGK